MIDRRPRRSLRRRLRVGAKQIAFAINQISTRLGLHVLPAHYYTPVPNLAELEKTRERWARRSELPGITVDLAQQVENLRSLCLPYQAEFAGGASWLEAVAGEFGPGYGFIEAQALHGVIRSLKPRRIIEVGSGVSTYCAMKAAALNATETGEETRITAIEPYPSAFLRTNGAIELIQSPVQAVEPSVFQQLGPDDLLFIDSSHVVQVGSDVNYLILEILPRLNPGVVVHFHDIFFPYDYQRNVLATFMHWAETSLLRAFLVGNRGFEIVFCMSQLHYDRPEDLRAVFPEYSPSPGVNGMRLDDRGRPHHRGSGFLHLNDDATHFPTSIYLRVVGPNEQ